MIVCWGLTCQSLWGILCLLPEKGRKEIAEEMKERDREERGTGMTVKKQKKLELSENLTIASLQLYWRRKTYSVKIF